MSLMMKYHISVRIDVHYDIHIGEAGSNFLVYIFGQ